MKRRGAIIGTVLFLVSLCGTAVQAAPALLQLSGDTAVPPSQVVLGTSIQDVQKKVLIDVDRINWRTYRFTAVVRGFGSAPLRYFWEFGDERTADVESPKHTYNSWGIYEIHLTVTDASTGFTLTSDPVEVDITFFDVANSKLWILLAAILIANILIVKMLRAIRKRREDHFKWSNKRSEHPVLIRKKHKPYMKKPPVS